MSLAYKPHPDETAPVASHNAFNIDWFVLSGDRITSNPLTKTAVSAIDTTNFGNTTLGSDRKLEIMAPVNSMESRVERIVQYILPRD